MKRLFGLKKKKIKIGGDEDDNNAQDDTSNNNRSYSPPSVGNNTSRSSAYDFKQVSDFPDVGVDFDNGTAGLAHPKISSSTDHNNDDTIGAGYRYALTAYNDTINPAVSNEDGMGGGGGTLRSRLRGSGGKNNRSLIPSFQPLDSNNYNDARGMEKSRTPLHNNLQSSRNNDRRDEGWSPIPEEPRSTSSSDDNREEEEEEGGDDTNKSSQRVVKFDAPIEEYNVGQVIPPSSTRSTHTSQQTSPSNQSQQHQRQQKQHQPAPILQPDAIYEEKYGDAYIDKLPKYLYPSGYQSMRPRSGPWKLSMFIFGLFLWLSVFIVGHCYDRGKQYGIIDDDAVNNNNGDDDANNNKNNNAVDDAYLEEFDDDAVLMETRWCGSKLLHFMWMISVAITMLAMSYCSIIGYVKVRDIAVAAGRSQPAGTFDGGDEDGLKSDYYSKVDNVCGNSGGNDEESGSNPNNSNSQYSSYQAGLDGNRRYEPSIYQSNGMPQFLGGHIYRPTQAAISMTNRP